MSLSTPMPTTRPRLIPPAQLFTSVVAATALGGTLTSTVEHRLTRRDTAPTRRLTLVYPAATAPPDHLAILPQLSTEARFPPFSSSDIPLHSEGYSSSISRSLRFTSRRSVAAIAPTLRLIMFCLMVL